MMLMNKRDAVLALKQEGPVGDYVPAAFFLHFDPTCQRGQAAIDKHLEYFRFTEMDLVKIQYERNFPLIPALTEPGHWADVPSYDEDFYRDPLDVVEGIVKAAKQEAVVVVTLYSPFMLACQTAGADRVIDHLSVDPDAVATGLKRITESFLRFVTGCMTRGVDGFYVSTQGGESGRLASRELFDGYVRPFDLEVWNEIDGATAFNILHVCDYEGPYDDLRPYADYPGDVVSTAVDLKTGAVTGSEISSLFGRPFMGGLDRHGIIVTGGEAEIRDEAERVLRAAPERFILGADCTLPSDIDWRNIRTAIRAAHQHRRS